MNGPSAGDVESLIELPRGHKFIDEEALDRWRSTETKWGGGLSADNNTVWRLVATIDYFRAEAGTLRRLLEEVRGDLEDLYFGKHDADRLAAGILAQKHIVDGALTRQGDAQ